jgi:hypothetical protein
MTLVAGEILEEREFAAGEFDQLAVAPDAMREEIDAQIAAVDRRRELLVGAAGEGAEAGEQLLEGERFGEVVIGAGRLLRRRRSAASTW